MDVLLYAVQSVLGVGAVAILPIVILLLGLFFRVKPLEALKCGLFVGIGFQGIQLVVSFLVATLNPIIQHYVDAGTGFTIVDVGWETLSAASWAVPYAALVVPLGLILNFILIRLKVTQTLNVDIWNYHHILRVSALVSLVLAAAGLKAGFANYAISVLFCLILSAFLEKVGDWIAPWWHRYFGLEGTTCTTFTYIGTALPIAVVSNKVIDLIPGLNKVELTYERLYGKIGELSNPTIIGAIIGAFLAVLTGQDAAGIIKIAVGLSAAITLTPRMVKLFMEGMAPVSAAARDYMITKLGPDEDFNIGVDVALGVGDQTAITCSSIMIPISIALAFILPGNSFFPSAFFGSSLLYLMCIVCMVTKGNIVRSLIVGTVYMLFLYFAFNFTAPLCTAFVANSGVMDITAGMQVTASGMNDFFAVILRCIYGLFA